LLVNSKHDTYLDPTPEIFGASLVARSERVIGSVFLDPAFHYKIEVAGPTSQDGNQLFDNTLNMSTLKN
jgi:hypothetical protein